MFEKFTERGRKIIIYAKEEAERRNNDYMGSEHLLLGIVREDEGVAGKVIRNLGANLLAARQLTINLAVKPQFQQPSQKERRKTNTPALDEFGRDLTLLAIEG